MSASLKKGPTGGPRIVPFYVLEKVWCNAKTVQCKTYSIVPCINGAMYR